MPMARNSSHTERSRGNLTFLNAQIPNIAIVANITRQAAIANGEKSAKAMAMHKKEVPHNALTSSSRETSRVVGGRISVKFGPQLVEIQSNKCLELIAR